MEVSDFLEESYEILGLLGQGGFGVVYKAKQRTTGQLVAIKTLLPRTDATRSEKLIGRFMRETRLCAQLYHPNIVQLINAGKTAKGQLYTVFVYVPGQSLSEVLAEEGALDPQEARHLMLQVLDALACAHDRGIIHRDLKPGNIMVIPTGARRNALVLDFGIGTVVKDMSSTEHERLTGTSDTLGTPGYAAPEQLNRLESLPTTDLFAWGLVFIECLTGQPVYSGATWQEIVFKQLGSEPVNVPVALQNHPLGKLLEEVTRKDPAARPQTAAALLKRLEGCSLRGISRAVIAGDVAVPFPRNFLSTSTAMGTRPGEAAEQSTASERRQVTALCCTLKLRAAQKESSSHEASKHVLDVEEQNRLLIELFGGCAQGVQEHRGFLVATFGEQALFFFGYPQADEQDGKRAARAALALRTALAAESERLQKRGIELAARIGIHSGLVVAPPSPDIIDASLTIGVTPTIAARIAERSSPGTIVVSGVVQRILRSSFDFEAQGALDDASEPLRLFRLQGEHTGGAATARSAESAAPLVGREPEVKLLVQRWVQAQQGTGQCSLISGEPGIGKSRLARALHERIEKGPHVFLSLRSSPDAQNSPLFPVIDLIERLLDRESTTAQTGKLARLESLLSGHGLDPSASVPLMAALLSIPFGDRYPALDISAELQKKRTLEAIRALLFAMAEARPVFMLVEDLHWVDPTTLELLGQMIERVSSAPVYMVFTARPEFSQTSLPAAGVLQISLSRLGSDDIEALVAELFEGRDVPEEVLKQIIKRTDGVPLFVEEFAQMLTESGVLVLRGDSYELARPLRDSDIPSSLRDLLTSRLDRLGKAKETAQLAATLGREFGLALLSATSERGPGEVQADLEKLQAAGLVQSKRKKDDKGYVFKHALIRDAAYESIALVARRNVHARVARTLEDKFASIARARPELLAQHHAGAASYAVAVRYGTRAAQSSLDRSSNQEAMSQAALVSTWLPELDDGVRAEPELDIKTIELSALMSRDGWASPSVRALAEASRALLPKSTVARHSALILFSLFIHYHVASNRAARRATADELSAFAEASGDAALRPWAALAQGVCYHPEGRMLDSERWLERALELYDAERDREYTTIYNLDCRGWALAQLAHVEFAIGRTKRAFSLAEAAIAWAREINHIPALGIALLYLGQINQIAGNREGALERATELIQVSARYGLPAYEGYGAAVASWAKNDDGGVAAVIDALASLNCNLSLNYYRSFRAEIEANAGNIPAAIAHAEACLKLCGDHDERWFEPNAIRLRAMLELRRPEPDLDLVRDLLTRTRGLAREQGAARIERVAILDHQKLFGDAEDLGSRLAQIHEAIPDLNPGT